MSDQIAQWAMSASGALVAAIGWWLATTIDSLGEKMERVLVKLESHTGKLESHDARIQGLETREQKP